MGPQDAQQWDFELLRQSFGTTHPLDAIDGAVFSKFELVIPVIRQYGGCSPPPSRAQ